jgi:hypothetical protein
MRLAWLIALVGWLVLGGILLVLLPMLRPIPDEKVAEAVEKQYPVLQERLLTTIELSHAGAAAGASSSLITQLAQETAGMIAPLDFSIAIPTRSLRRPLLLAVLAAILILGHLLFAPEAMLVWLNRILHPHADIPIYASTQVWVTPGNKVMPRGEDINLGVRIGGRAADYAALHYRFGDGNWSTVKLTNPQAASSATAQVRQFTYHVQDVQQNIEYYATANDGHSNPRLISVEDRPAILSVRLGLSFPAYMRRKPETVIASAGNIVAPAGTEVTVKAVANKPIQEASFYENGVLRRDWPASGDIIRGSLTVMRDETYSIHLKDHNGFIALTPPQYTVRAQPDMPPTVQIVQPAQDVERTPDGMVNLKITASDDYGVNALQLNYRNAGRSGVVPLPGANGAKFAGMTGPWDLTPLRLKSGDTVTYYALARDNDNITGPHIGKSISYCIRVVSYEEMRNRIESALEQQEEALQQLIKHQKEAQASLNAARNNQSHPDQLNQAQASQRNVAQEASDLAQQMSQTLTQMNDNNMSIPGELKRRQGAQSLLSSLANNAMPHAADTIQHAAQQSSTRSQDAASAAQQEQAIRNQLEQIAIDISRGPEAPRLAQIAQQLSNEQHRLADQTNLLHAKMENKSSSQMNAQERQEASNIAAKQQSLQERTQDLVSQVKAAATAAAERNSPNASMMRQASNEAQQANMPQSQSQAQKQLQSGHPQESAHTQNQVSRDLQQLASNLNQASTHQNSSNLSSRAEKLDQMANKLENMARQQENIANQASGNPDTNTSKNLGEQQKGLEQTARTMAPQMSDAPAAQKNVQNAAQNMQQSGNQLEKPAPQSAVEPAHEAAQQLNRAAETARQTAQMMREQQKALAMQHQVEQLAQEQRSIATQTQSLDTHRQSQNGNLNSEQQQQAEKLAQNQSKLADRTQSLGNQMPSDEFRWAMNEAHNRMANAETGLQQKNTSPETQRYQLNAAKTLERIARALGQQANGAQQQAESGNENQQGSQQMAQSLGDLTLAREMQAQIQEETTGLDQRRNANPDRNLSGAQQRELNTLNDEQRQTQRITRTAGNTLRSQPDVAQNVQQAADEMQEVQGKLEQQHTGTATQGQQQHIVDMLDRAISKTQDAMRNQQQQMASSNANQQAMPQPQNQNSKGTHPAMKSLPRQTGVQEGAFAKVRQGGKGFTGLDPRSMAAMREGQNERVPAEYRDLVNEYYKALSEKAR